MVVFWDNHFRVCLYHTIVSTKFIHMYLVDFGLLCDLVIEVVVVWISKLHSQQLLPKESFVGRVYYFYLCEKDNERNDKDRQHTQHAQSQFLV